MSRYKIDSWTLAKSDNEVFLFEGLVPSSKHELIDVCRMEDYEKLESELEKVKEENLRMRWMERCKNSKHHQIEGAYCDKKGSTGKCSTCDNWELR